MICLTELQNKMQLQQKISEVRNKRVAGEESAENLQARLFPEQQQWAVPVLGVSVCSWTWDKGEHSAVPPFLGAGWG